MRMERRGWGRESVCEEVLHTGVARKHELGITRRIWRTVGKWGVAGGQTDTKRHTQHLGRNWSVSQGARDRRGCRDLGAGWEGGPERGGGMGAGSEQSVRGSEEGHCRGRRGIVEWEGREAGRLVRAHSQRLSK